MNTKGQDPVPPEKISDRLGIIAPSSFSISKELWGVGWGGEQQFKNRRTHVQKDILSFPPGRSWQAPAGSNGAGLLRPLHCLGLFGGSEPKPPSLSSQGEQSLLPRPHKVLPASSGV